MHPVVSLDGVTKVYRGNVRALDNLDFEAWKGRVTGIIGPNGAGKTTILRLIVGMLKPTSGTVRCLGHLMPDEAEKVRGEVGYMPQNPITYPSLRVEEFLRYSLRLAGVDDPTRRVNEVMERLGVIEYKNYYGMYLSIGLRRLTLLAAALAREPSLLLLDEPTSMVDIVRKGRVWSAIERSKRDSTVIICTHDMREAERLADFIYVLNNGRILLKGTPSEVCRAIRLPIIVRARLRPSSNLDIESYRGLPGVTVSFNGEWLVAEAGDVASALSLLNRVLGSGGIEELEVGSGGLEEAIATLFKEGYRAVA